MPLSTAESTPGDQGDTLDDNAYSGDEDRGLGPPEEDTPQEKVACERCRRRKIKCDRVQPCTQCIRAQSQCSYPVAPKRVKRQRVLISSMYESRIEHISQKIDDLARLMEGLNAADRKEAVRPEENRSQTYPLPPEDKKIPRFEAPDGHGMERSLFSHAIAAMKFVEEAVKTAGDEQRSSTTEEMSVALGTLQAVVGSQKRRTGPEDDGPPFKITLPPGTTTRDLPVPPIDKVMACLRMAQESASVPMTWLGEFKSLGDFTLYVIKVCSPGPATDADLIIAYMGLYCLFAECATMTSAEAREDLNKQAQTCQDGLEAVLSNLGFHAPTTIDNVLAMYFATLYCFQRGMVFAAWTFVSKASLLAQALGLHVASMSIDTLEERLRRARLFWSIYCLEKGLALCLMRPSTIQDHYITIPWPDTQASDAATAHPSLPHSTNTARLCGLIYDDIYSPKALAEPPATRAARVHALAAEWRRALSSKTQYWTTLAQKSEGEREASMFDFSARAAAVGDNLLLTAIYRAEPGPNPDSISAECKASARITLRGQTECITHLLDKDPQSALIKLWVNGALLLLPFIPFNIVFCNVVETGDREDLESLGALVQAMARLAEKPGYGGCGRQLQVFRALHTVATRYVEVMSRPGPGKGFANDTLTGDVASSSLVTPSDDGYVMSGTGLGSALDGNCAGDQDLLAASSDFEPQNWAGLREMELDPFGMQLSAWFQGSGDGMDYLGG